MKKKEFLKELEKCGDFRVAVKIGHVEGYIEASSDDARGFLSTWKSKEIGNIKAHIETRPGSRRLVLDD